MPPSQAYRNPTVDDDDDDDLDDLDGVLASFNTPAASRPAASSAAGPSRPPTQPPHSSGLAPATSSAAGPARPPALAEDDDDDFEASLAEGMESLLRQLATAHPPGPMPDAAGVSKDQARDPSQAGADRTASTAEAGGKGGALSPEEEEAAWQRAVEMMLSGEGLAALGLDDDKSPSKDDARGAPATGKAQPTFDETIRRTMESLKTAGTKPAGRGDAFGDDAGLAELLKKLSTDPSALDGLGDGDDEDGLGGLLDGMMSQLMTKEVLEEPMAELASKYPGYLASPPTGTSSADLDKYRQQHALVTKILDTFRKPGYTDEKDGKEIARLVSEMQDLGGPPKEIMGDLPDGFDLAALGSEDGCVVM